METKKCRLSTNTNREETRFKVGEELLQKLGSVSYLGVESRKDSIDDKEMVCLEQAGKKASMM